MFLAAHKVGSPRGNEFAQRRGHVAARVKVGVFAVRVPRRFLFGARPLFAEPLLPVCHHGRPRRQGCCL